MEQQYGKGSYRKRRDGRFGETFHTLLLFRVGLTVPKKNKLEKSYNI
jgi:hypothetical protein